MDSSSSSAFVVVVVDVVPPFLAPPSVVDAVHVDVVDDQPHSSENNVSL